MPSFICKNCGEVVSSSYEKNSTLGCAAWLFFIFISMGIGLIFYVIYKLNNKSKNCCPVCKAENTLITVDSPIGRKMIDDLSLLQNELEDKTEEDAEENLSNKSVLSENINTFLNKNEHNGGKIITIIVCTILGIMVLGKLIELSELISYQQPKVIEYKNYKMKEIYRFPDFSLYVYHIPKNNFNLKKFVNYAQSMPRNSKTGTNFFFVYDDTFDVKTLNGISKQIPLYILDDLWKRKPYFYFTSAFGISENFCKIDGTSQELYNRNLKKGERYFEHIMSYDYKYLDAKIGCTTAGHDI